MTLTRTALILGTGLALAGCVEDGMDSPISAVGQEQACAGRFADEIGLPMSAIRTNSTDSRNGNAVIFMQTSDGASRANCEVDATGMVVALDVTR